MKKTLLVVFAGLGLSISAFADPEPQSNWYVLTGANYTLADGYLGERQGFGARGGEFGFGWALGTGWVANERFNFELAVTNKHLNADTVDDIDQYGFEGNALFFLSRNHRMAPFLMAGLGGVDTARINNQGFEMYATAGLGFVSRLGDGAGAASLRADARYYEELGSISLNDASVNVALHIPVGAPPPPAPPPAPPVSDRDGDGVPDGRDRCPGTPAGARVDSNGCESDADGDGVGDSRDRCPGTAPGTRVDARGCEADSDGDGVADSKDRCPGTARGTQVDVRGCEIKATIELPGVNFASSSAELTPGSLGVLREAAATLKKNPGLVVEVAGHTDSSGGAALNRRLSQARANSVMQFLVSEGIAAERLSARGYGEDQPIADNETAAGKARNRRVELRILKR